MDFFFDRFLALFSSEESLSNDEDDEDESLDDEDEPLDEDDDDDPEELELSEELEELESLSDSDEEEEDDEEDFDLKLIKDIIGLDMQFFLTKLKLFSYQSVEAYILGAQKNRLIETVLLSTHNICFG